MSPPLSNPIRSFIVQFMFLSIYTSKLIETTRLPKSCQPIDYHVTLNFPRETLMQLDRNFFNGKVDINFKVMEDISKIQLNIDSKHLKISSLSVDNWKSNHYFYDIDNETDILTISSNTVLKATNNNNQTHQLSIKFDGLLSTVELLGAYKSTYVDSSTGKRHYVIATQAAPISTRMMFPCFDEPRFKAVFSMDILVPNGFSAISNTLPESVQQFSSSSILYNFRPTPLMSPYLVAFVVSEFTCLQQPKMTGGDDVIFKICSRKSTISKRQWSLDVAPKILDKLNQFTDINYSNDLTSLGFAGVGDFSFDAMENWGLPIFSESTLLWDPVLSSNSHKQFTTRKLAHDISHQWFGNLVTCEWWSLTYLNEAFAAYFEYEIVQQIFPNWEMESQFNVDVLHAAFQSDSSSQVPALESSVDTTNDILQKIGQSFSKGGSIFRMIRHILGENEFKMGLRNYLKLYRYKTVVTKDLWKGLSTALNITNSKLPSTIDTVMTNWIEKPGFPIVTATLIDSEVKVTQERYMLNGTDNSQWYIPITFTLSTDLNKFVNTLPQYWLIPNANLQIPLTKDVNWIILNNQQTGYLRVNYNEVLWQGIASALTANNFSDIIDSQRAQIVDDIFNLALINKTSYQNLYNVIDFLKQDTSYFAWVPAFNGFQFLINRIALQSILGKAITSNILGMMENLLTSVPLSKTDDTDMLYTIKQVLSQKWACKLGQKECVEQAKLYFSSYKSDGVRPNKNLNTIIYCTALAKSSDRANWDLVWNEYLKSDDASEKMDLLTALSCTMDKDILKEFLNETISKDSVIRPQDRYKVFSSIVDASPVGYEVAFDFLLKNYDDISNRYQDINNLPGSINAIAKKINTEEELTKLTDLIENKIPEKHKNPSMASIEEAQMNIKWNKDHLAELFNIKQLNINSASKLLGKISNVFS